MIKLSVRGPLPGPPLYGWGPPGGYRNSQKTEVGPARGTRQDDFIGCSTGFRPNFDHSTPQGPLRGPSGPFTAVGGWHESSVVPPNPSGPPLVGPTPGPHPPSDQPPGPRRPPRGPSPGPSSQRARTVGVHRSRRRKGVTDPPMGPSPGLNWPFWGPQWAFTGPQWALFGPGGGVFRASLDAFRAPRGPFSGPQWTLFGPQGCLFASPASPQPSPTPAPTPPRALIGPHGGLFRA